METLGVDLVMEVKKIIHKGYEEFQEAKKEGIKIKQYFGKYQYIYSKRYSFRFWKNVEISMVQLFDIFRKVWFWEIYCLRGSLFDGCERFATQKDAIKRIKELLK